MNRMSEPLDNALASRSFTDAAAPKPEPVTPPSPPPPSWSRRIVQAIRFLIGLSAAMAIASTALLEAFAWLLPQRFDDPDASRDYARLVLVSYFARTFLFYAALPVLVAAAIAFAARWRRTAVVGLVAGLLMLMPLFREYIPKSTPVVHGPTMRILSMNVYVENSNFAAIHAAIDAANADVIVLVEIDWRNWHPIIDPLTARYPHEFSGNLYGAGVVVLSRLPFLNPATQPTHPGFPRPLVFNLGGRELALYGVHLVSPRRHTWYIERNREQTETLAKLAEESKRPIVIAGDLNFSQLSPNYFRISSTGLRSTQDIVGFGVGNTWGPIWSPWMNRILGFRIDHILLSPQLTATTHHVGPDTGSDHRPIIADIGFADDQQGSGATVDHSSTATSR